MEFTIVLAIGLFAGTVGGIVGTGSSMILMPALVLAWGPLEAVPVMAIAAILGNLGRVIAWRREVDWRAAWMVCLAAIPGAVLGVRTLLAGPLGFLTGIVVSTGPLTVPLFTMYGLDKGGLLGTEGLASFAVYAAKVATFRVLDALPAAVAIKGLVAGSALMAGSFAGRLVVLRLAPATFRLMIDGLMVFSGGTLLWAATR